MLFQFNPALLHHLGLFGQVGEHELSKLLSQQVVIGEMRVRARQKFLNGIEPIEEAGGQLDPVRLSVTLLG